jgi:hypothetical protein
MTLTGLPPRAPGKSLGLSCWTGQRWRLSAVPLLKAPFWLQVEYWLLQLEVDDASLQRRLLHKAWTSGAQRMHALALPRRLLHQFHLALPPTCQLSWHMMGARYVGLSSLGAAIVHGSVWQRQSRCLVVPSLNASPFLAGGKARRGLMSLLSVVEGISLPSCSRLVRTVVCVCVCPSIWKLYPRCLLPVQ